MSAAHLYDVFADPVCGTNEGTSLCNKSWGQVLTQYVNWPFLLQHLVPRIQIGLDFSYKSLRIDPQNASCELFVGQVPAATSPFV